MNPRVVFLLGCLSSIFPAVAHSQAFCSPPGRVHWHHALFGDAAAKETHDGVVRVYFDRLGAVYPAGSQVPKNSAFGPAATLQCYYSQHPAVFSHLLRENSVADTGKFPARWEAVQDTLFSRISRRLAELLVSRDGHPKTLVVLVHGFRVDDASEAFASARAAIQQLMPPGQVVFLEVNWDGLTGFQAVWFEARTNAPLAGLELRRILAGVRPETPIRIVTHSLGASVAASALWNRHRDLDRHDQSFGRYFANVGGNARYPLRTHGDIRLGMLVPAISGAAMPDSGNRPAALGRVIVGQNSNDLAVQKVFRLPKVGGSTALAVNDDEYCDFVEKIFRPQSLLIDFKKSTLPLPVAVESHDFGNYIQNGREFFEDLLKDTPPALHAGTGRRVPGRPRTPSCNRRWTNIIGG